MLALPLIKARPDKQPAGPSCQIRFLKCAKKQKGPANLPAFLRVTTSKKNRGYVLEDREACDQAATERSGSTFFRRVSRSTPAKSRNRFGD